SGSDECRPGPERPPSWSSPRPPRPAEPRSKQGPVAGGGLGTRAPVRSTDARRGGGEPCSALRRALGGARARPGAEKRQTGTGGKVCGPVFQLRFKGPSYLLTHRNPASLQRFRDRAECSRAVLLALKPAESG